MKEMLTIGILCFSSLDEIGKIQCAALTRFLNRAESLILYNIGNVNQADGFFYTKHKHFIDRSSEVQTNWYKKV